MGERMGRIGRIETDFFGVRVFGIREKIKKKSVSIRPIRPIRSPIVSPLSKAEIVATASKNPKVNYLSKRLNFRELFSNVNCLVG
jgi:hypothetical protein